MAEIVINSFILHLACLGHLGMVFHFKTTLTEKCYPNKNGLICVCSVVVMHAWALKVIRDKKVNHANAGKPVQHINFWYTRLNYLLLYVC